MADFCQMTSSWTFLKVTNAVIASIGLIISISLGVQGSRKLFFNEKSRKILSIFKAIFMVVILLSIIICISVIFGLSMCAESQGLGVFVSQVFGIIPYHLLTLTLDITLYARLHFVFGATNYKINKYYFGSLFCATFLATVVSITGASLYLSAMYRVKILHDFTDIETNVQRALSVSTSGLLMYIILSIWALTLFTKNLNSLAQIHSVHVAQETEIEALDASSETVVSEFRLNKQQQKLMYQQTKYLVLLSIALLSSCTFYLILLTQGFFGKEYVVQHSRQVNAIFEGVDIIINVIALYFQYSFSNQQYGTFCGCCDKLCYGLLKRRMQTFHLARVKSTVQKKIKSSSNQNGVDTTQESTTLDGRTIYVGSDATYME